MNAIEIDTQVDATAYARNVEKKLIELIHHIADAGEVWDITEQQASTLYYYDSVIANEVISHYGYELEEVDPEELDTFIIAAGDARA